MCIRDRITYVFSLFCELISFSTYLQSKWRLNSCLLYTSDAADDLLCVDLGGRRIIKKKYELYNSSLHILISKKRQYENKLN